MMDLKEPLFKSILDNIYDGVYIVDSDRAIIYWNKGAERITGFKAPEIIGRRCRDNLLMHVDSTGAKLCSSEKCPALAVINGGGERIEEVFVNHKEGYRIPVLTRITKLTNEKGNIVGAIEIFTDNRETFENRQKIETLEKLSLLDELTEVGNRKYAHIQIRNILDASRWYGWRYGIIFIDVDHFKQVNDKYGHNAGDQVLKMVAKTLASGFRKSDLVCRWGGEEFVALMFHAEEQAILAAAERIRRLVENTKVVVHQLKEISVTVSLGATMIRA
ncbi:MAG: diguanylate cyclase, partial [Desulfomonilaceae bacterium]